MVQAQRLQGQGQAHEMTNVQSPQGGPSLNGAGDGGPSLFDKVSSSYSCLYHLQKPHMNICYSSCPRFP